MSNSTESTPPNENPRPRLLMKRPNPVLQRKVLVIPSCITVVAFFSGFLAVIMAIRGDFEYAVRCILIAIVFDGLDGRVARKLNAATAFGREFDSLSDVVAFGVAPAIALYQWAFLQNADEFGVLVAFLFVVCCGGRLARFNIAESEPAVPGTVEVKKNFQGMPTPGAAAALASCIYLHPASVTSPFWIAGLATYSILLSFLMVSSVPFLSIKHLKLTQKNAKLLLPVIAAFVALAWYHSRLFFFVTATGYALSGPVLGYLQLRKGTGESSKSQQVAG